ncbi:MAG TPA: transketolase [Bacteroidetes bacterium]|nr:transketolase [Bacteroidota bacterium]
MLLTKAQITELEQKARKLRYLIVEMVSVGKQGHIGGSCSIADVMAVLYFHKMKHDPLRPNWPDRDRLLLSKGHAALVQYAALAECGYFSREHLATLKQTGSILQGHPDMLKTPGIEANTGSLGQGLSIACGMAMAGKLDRKDYRVFCVLGDGEIAEGQIWEASMAAGFYKLDNLTAILDKNGIQATGPVAERFDTNPHREKWLACGWHVIETDGHRVGEIDLALNEAEKIHNRPTLIIAHTVKGKGVPFAEDTAAFHNGIMDQAQYEQALECLKR